MRTMHEDVIWRGQALRERAARAAERERGEAPVRRRREDADLAKRRRARRRLAIGCVALALASFGHAGYLSAKAKFAQVLLERSWRAARSGATAPPPWPWADTVPVARLALPRLAVDEIVLAGDAGRTLAFGPGWAQASAPPGSDGVTVVSGHRDTHFAFLRDVAIGDAVTVETARSTVRYRVASMRIADATKEALAAGYALDAPGAHAAALVLVTCYPFDSLVPGGPLRYVVVAEPERAADAPALAPPQLVGDASHSAPRTASVASFTGAVTTRNP